MFVFYKPSSIPKTLKIQQLLKCVEAPGAGSGDSWDEVKFQLAVSSVVEWR